MYSVLVYLCVVSAAMLTGLMVVLTTVLRPLWAQEPEALAARGFQTFLRFASANPVLLALSIVPVLGGIVIAFLDAPGTARPGFALAGGGVFLLGYLVCTVVVNAPLYRDVLTWDPSSSPTPVMRLLRRFHTTNLVRLAATSLSTVLFLAAA